MRAVFGLVDLDTGTVQWRGATDRSEERARFGYMPEERGLYPANEGARPLVYLGGSAVVPRQDVGRSSTAGLQRLGLAYRASDRLDALSHGNHSGSS